MAQMHKIKQIAKGVGTTLPFSLDPPTRQELHKALDWLNAHKYPTTLSVTIRRALRAYQRLLKDIESKDEVANDLIELDRARKGVL